MRFLNRTTDNVFYSLAADTTLNASELGTVHYINCTANSALTLPGAVEGTATTIFNAGSAIVTVKDGATTLCTLGTNQWCIVPALVDSSGLAQWPDAVAVFSLSGNMYLQGDLVIRNSAKGIVWTDTTDSHFVRGVITADALATTDLGGTEPS